MDSDSLISIATMEPASQKVVQGKPVLNFTEDCHVSGDTNGPSAEVEEVDLANGGVGIVVDLNENGRTQETQKESYGCTDNNSLNVNNQGEVKGAEDLEHSGDQKASGKSKNDKHLGSRNTSTLVKKSNTRNVAKVYAASNSSMLVHSHAKQPLQRKAFADRKVSASQQTQNSDAALSGSHTEKEKNQPSRKGPIIKEDDMQSFSAEENTKSRKMGALPNYGFSFRCDERAEKRREFYSKLEEKIHAREVEQSNLQAKSKETQEAEIKMLRKSLNFKATPMPSFYQEPPPPKVELKKIPPTRAKSPKLGRKKPSSPKDSTENSHTRLGRLSLDSKSSSTDPIKVHGKKPQRKSLSKLPSEKTRMSDTDNNLPKSNTKRIPVSSSLTNEETCIAQEQGVLTGESGDTYPDKSVSVSEVREGQAQPENVPVES